jgi:hypothetical protein
MMCHHHHSCLLVAAQQQQQEEFSVEAFRATPAGHRHCTADACCLEPPGNACVAPAPGGMPRSLPHQPASCSVQSVWVADRRASATARVQAPDASSSPPRRTAAGAAPAEPIAFCDGRLLLPSLVWCVSLFYYTRTKTVFRQDRGKQQSAVQRGTQQRYQSCRCCCRVAWVRQARWCQPAGCCPC